MAEPSVPKMTEEPSASEKETARTHMREGDRLFDAERYAEALVHYRAADDIMGVPTTGLAVGRAEERLGHWVEAQEAWLAVARYPVTSNEPVPFTQARTDAQRLAQALGPRIPALVVRLEEDAPQDQVSVRIDQAVILHPELQHKLNPGTHEVQIEAAGYQPVTRTVVLREGEVETLSIPLVRLPEPAPVSAPGLAETDPTPANAPRGDKPERTAPSNLPLWIGFGVGAVGVVTGSVFGILSTSETGRLRDRCPNDVCARSQQDDIDTATLHANLANVGFAVGAVGIGFGLWHWLNANEPNEEARVDSSSLSFDLGPAGASLSGSF